MSRLQELILKLRDLCGILWLRFRLSKRKVLSFWQPILWKRLRLYVRKWASWSRENSSALVVPPISKTNMEQVLSLKPRSEAWQIKKLTNLLIKLKKRSCFHSPKFLDVLSSCNNLELLSSFQKWQLMVLVLNTFKWRWRRLRYQQQISLLGNTHSLVDKSS